jgi:hypothetical protein
VAVAQLNRDQTMPLEGLETEVNIAMETFKGVVCTRSAFDPEGRVMRSISRI